ncbi:uncharacterized protein B0T15DRAFT_522179 [Chaetomium strumarium]|uniref:Uncharacterized protein n=1 Tax=Chaetomium strumarium TaxID=1170767 RepID=A0AAJ0M7G0_9PEZI|nr:hypothetical protein B0T15DRAFT_522179 [Chaetomium strumarium]
MSISELEHRSLPIHIRNFDTYLYSQVSSGIMLSTRVLFVSVSRRFLMSDGKFHNVDLNKTAVCGSIAPFILVQHEVYPRAQPRFRDHVDFRCLTGREGGVISKDGSRGSWKVGHGIKVVGREVKGYGVSSTWRPINGIEAGYLWLAGRSAVIMLSRLRGHRQFLCARGKTQVSIDNRFGPNRVRRATMVRLILFFSRLLK